MHELIGKAREEDEQFWQQLGFFQEPENDDDYVESDNAEDVVDSDFDQPEEENQESEKEDDKERAVKKNKIKERIFIKHHHHKAEAKIKEGEKVDGPFNTEQPSEDSSAFPAKKVKRLAAETLLPIEQVCKIKQISLEICGSS